MFVLRTYIFVCCCHYLMLIKTHSFYQQTMDFILSIECLLPKRRYILRENCVVIETFLSIFYNWYNK